MVETGEYVKFENGTIFIVTPGLKTFINEHESRSEKDYEDYVDNYIQIGTDRILRPYTRILNGHNTEYCDKLQTNIKDEFLDTLYDLFKANLIVKE